MNDDTMNLTDFGNAYVMLGKWFGEEVRSGHRGLDIGTGSGELLSHLINTSPGAEAMQWEAIDIYDGILPKATAVLAGCNCKVREGNGNDLKNYQDDYFNFVLGVKSCFAPEEVHRVLKKGGHYLYLGPGKNDWKELKEMAVVESTSVYKSQEEVETDLICAGFEVLKLVVGSQPKIFEDVEDLVGFLSVSFREFSRSKKQCGEKTKLLRNIYSNATNIHIAGEEWVVLAEKC